MDNGTDFTAALHDSEYWSLVLAASSSDAPFALRNVHIARFAADDGFVRLDVSAGLLDRAIVKRHANAMVQEPCGLLSDTKIAGHFAGTNAVLAIHDKPERRKPLVETDRRIFHQGAGLQ